jgi:hypothetical protein
MYPQYNNNIVKKKKSMFNGKEYSPLSFFNNSQHTYTVVIETTIRREINMVPRKI